MSRFYIKRISVSGEKVRTSTVEFGNQVNIILGPSNTGKSYIIGCINFMFGGENPPFSKSTGYDKITMYLEDSNGDVITVERPVPENGEKSLKIKITSSLVEIQSLECGLDRYRKLLLVYVMGVTQQHKLIKNKQWTTQKLTIRTLFRYFFISEEYIFTKKSVFHDLVSPQITSLDMTALHFLLTGEDLHQLIPPETSEDKKEKETKNKNISGYLHRKIEEMNLKYQEILQLLNLDKTVDVNHLIDTAMEKFRIVNSQIQTASKESQNLLAKIYQVSSELEEARFLSQRYEMLHEQYKADIERLKFIIDGEKKHYLIPEISKCPFCESDIFQIPEESYIDAARNENIRIQSLMKQLQETQQDVAEEIRELETELQKLNTQNQQIVSLIDVQLKPEAEALENTVLKYKDLLVILEIIKELSGDIKEHQTENEPEIAPFDAKLKLNSAHWQALSKQFDIMVKACAYPDNPNSIIFIDTLDAVVNQKQKENEGKGYRAFLNTIMLFNLLKYLETSGKYSLHMLFLDSPILPLKDKEDSDAEEYIPPKMREALFEYIIRNCGENQIIIAENELPPNLDTANIHLIEFTRDENNGRYGFFKDYKKS